MKSKIVFILSFIFSVAVFSGKKHENERQAYRCMREKMLTYQACVEMCERGRKEGDPQINCCQDGCARSTCRQMSKCESASKKTNS